MSLYLHIGTEKTGSSYLQKVCANNREWLERSGYYFPSAGRDEKRLRTGTISPGNARELAELVALDAWDRIDRWLSDRMARASEKSCKNLLLSHELLFACLGRNGAMEQLMASAKRCGLDRIDALLFIRDPVDQAISLYKHRGKDGRIGTIDEWVHRQYSTAAELDQFVSVPIPKGVSVDIRKYSKQTSRLLGAFFVDWLGLDLPPSQVDEVVNPSLTLSEIEFLKELAKSQPDDVPLFYRKLLSVPGDSKASGEALELRARQSVSNYLVDFDRVWKKLDELLESDGGLEIPVQLSADSVVDEPFSFSSSQLRAIAESHQDGLSARHRVGLSFDKHLRPLLGRVKRALFS